MRSFGTVLTALAAACAVMSGPVEAQQWHLDVSGGRIRSVLDPGATTQSLALGLRYDDLMTAVRLSAGLPTESSEPLWAAAGGWQRLGVRMGAFLLGADLNGNAFVTRQRQTGTRRLPGPFRPETPDTESDRLALSGQAMALVAWEGIDIQIQARSGLSRYLPGTEGASPNTVHATDLQLTWAPVPSLVVIPAGRYFRSLDSDADAAWLGASAVIGAGRLSGWGSAGRYVDGVDPDAASSWGAGVMLRLQQRLTVQASARRDGYDPLYLTPPQTAWSIAASLLVGGRTSPAAPVPAAYDDGRATITVRVSDAPEGTLIAGDFNGWTPQPMERVGDVWSYTVTLDPGVYKYAFVTADGEWFVPENLPGRRDDGMGGHVAVLVVE